jgi:hypothetical protein
MAIPCRQISFAPIKPETESKWLNNPWSEVTLKNLIVGKQEKKCSPFTESEGSVGVCHNLYKTIKFERHPWLLKIAISFTKFIRRQLLKIIYITTVGVVSFEWLSQIICISFSLLCVIIQEGSCSLCVGDSLSGALAAMVQTEYLQGTGM